MARRAVYLRRGCCNNRGGLSRTRRAAGGVTVDHHCDSPLPTGTPPPSPRDLQCCPKVRPVGSACARHRAPPRYTKCACGRTLTDHRSHQRAGEADAGFARNAVFSFFQCPVVTDLLCPKCTEGTWHRVAYSAVRSRRMCGSPAWLRPECPPPGEFVCLCVARACRHHLSSVHPYAIPRWCVQSEPGLFFTFLHTYLPRKISFAN